MSEWHFWTIFIVILALAYWLERRLGTIINMLHDLKDAADKADHSNDTWGENG